MKIVLEYPYNQFQQIGYIHINDDCRRHITFRSSDGKLAGTSYARYLMAVKFGRFLTDQEEVDHIDDNKTNDDINNLQILTPEQNREKQRLHYINNVQQKFDLVCPNCCKDITLTEKEMNDKFRKHYHYNGSGLIFCSVSCSSDYHSEIRLKPENLIQEIKKLRMNGLSSYKIASELNISRNTVTKYW